MGRAKGGVNMTAEQYRVFYHVVESKSISKAAKVLYVSQPAVTKSIKTLESELGVILFVRTAKGVTLTNEGEILFTYVKEAFEQLAQGEKRIRQLKDRAYGSVRIGISNILCKYYFIPYLKTFHEKFPGIKIEIVNRTSPETLDLLEAGRIDCAIISDTGITNTYSYEQLMDIQDTFVAKNKPPQEFLPLKELENYPILLLEKKNATRKNYDEHFLENQVNVNVDIEISSMEFLIEFAKIGLGVSAVIGDFIQDELNNQTLYEWKVEPKLPKRSIGILYKSGDGLSIATKTFIKYMKEKNAIKG